MADGPGPRAKEGYEGVKVSIFADPVADQDEALAGLWEKAQQEVERPSTRAEETGWGRIDEAGGGYLIVIDGQRYTGEQFLALMSGYVGFNMHWKIADRTDPLPE